MCLASSPLLSPTGIQGAAKDTSQTDTPARGWGHPSNPLQHNQFINQRDRDARKASILRALPACRGSETAAGRCDRLAGPGVQRAARTSILVCSAQQHLGGAVSLLALNANGPRDGWAARKGETAVSLLIFLIAVGFEHGVMDASSCALFKRHIFMGPSPVNDLF